MDAMDIFHLLVGGLAVMSFSLWHFRRWSPTQRRCLDLVCGSRLFWSTPGTYRRYCVYYALTALSAFLILVAIFSAAGFQTILAVPAAFVAVFLFLTLPELTRRMDSLRGYLQRHAFHPSLPSGKELALLAESGYRPPAIISLQTAASMASVETQAPAPAETFPSARLVARDLVSQLHRISSIREKNEIDSLLRPVLKDEPFSVIPTPAALPQSGKNQEEAFLYFLLCLAVVRFIHYTHVSRLQRIPEIHHFLHPDPDGANI